jgi:hypothetical protein
MHRQLRRVVLTCIASRWLRSVVPCRTTAFAKASEQAFAYFFPLSAGGRFVRMEGEGNVCVIEATGKNTVKFKSTSYTWSSEELMMARSNKHRLNAHIAAAAAAKAHSSQDRCAERKGRAGVTSAAARQDIRATEARFRTTAGVCKQMQNDNPRASAGGEERRTHCRWRGQSLPCLQRVVS